MDVKQNKKSYEMTALRSEFLFGVKSNVATTIEKNEHIEKRNI